MVLQSFTIQGFKSFADKTVLSFDSGVTAVVGPNGSGKSNIAEAMSWVLGEQNPRALRCEKKMEELIFHGSAGRAPLGYAEASLLLDNSGGLFPYETGEVRITRRLYRSGESEYYINKSAVRLKDVLELFFDTGLGRDGYSIIGQGRISAIVSDKSGDRRRVFDEASGIARFRQRRDESQRKLQLAEDNLTRINDKIEELQWQLEPLKKQAEDAKAYLHMRDELRGIEINLWLDNLDKLRLGLNKIRSDCDMAAASLTERTQSLERLYAESEEFSERARENAVKTEQARVRLYEAESALKDTENERALIHSDMEHDRERAARLSEELGEHEERSAALKAQIAAREARLNELASERAGLEELSASILAETEALARESGDTAARMSLSRAKAEALRREAARVESLIASERATLESCLERVRQSEEAADGFLKAAEAAEAEKNKLSAALNEAREQVAAVDNALSGYRLRREKRSGRVAEQETELKRLGEKRAGLRSRYNTLSDMEHDYEGYSHAVKRVMQASERGALRGVHGVVGDILRVGDREATAIEIALGAAAQNIVVDTEEDAKAAITMLKQNDSGRATFLPLSSVRGTAITDNSWKNARGTVGLASALVEYEGRYDEIVRSLLGRTVVMDNLDNAIAFSKSSGYRHRLVTLDGQLINAGGSITGGSTGRNTGLLTRKNEIERLRLELDGLDKDVAQREKNLTELRRELSAVEYEIGVAEEERRQAQKDEYERVTALEHIETRISDEYSRAEAGLAERKTAQDRSAEAQAEIARLEMEKRKYESDAELCESEERELSGGQAGQTERGAGLAARLSEARERLSAVIAESESARGSMEEYSAMLGELSGSSEQRQRLSEELNARAEEYKRRLEELEIRRIESQARREAENAALEAVYEQARGLERERVQKDHEIKEANEEVIALERERARLESRKQSGENEEKQIIDRLWESYGLTHHDAAALRTTMESTAKATRRAAELRREMNAIGSPNIGSIEEYERVGARFEYLSAQRADAAESREKLLGIIDDISKEMKTIFIEQFTKINESFIETFKDMFGGGNAYLKLEDEDDILGSGVEIMAQPPGKILKSISLLSGGEKSLVAIALYFAIFKVHPSPFCVLDEIDHELDPVNVDRYAEYLKRLAAEKQFIVVTHRRGTMEIADRLYGVTSGEQGVTKVIGMKLEEAAATAVEG